MSPSGLTDANCGPANALQGLVKHIDRERGIQQDYFGADGAGSSRNTYRTHAPLENEANQFFAGPQSIHGVDPNPFQPLSLNGNLRNVENAIVGRVANNTIPVWATEFRAQQPLPSSHTQSSRVSEDFERLRSPEALPFPLLPQGQLGIIGGPLYAGSETPHFARPHYLASLPILQNKQLQSDSDAVWDLEFAKVDALSTAAKRLGNSEGIESQTPVPVGLMDDKGKGKAATKRFDSVFEIMGLHATIPDSLHTSPYDDGYDSDDMPPPLLPMLRGKSSRSFENESQNASSYIPAEFPGHLDDTTALADSHPASGTSEIPNDFEAEHAMHERRQSLLKSISLNSAITLTKLNPTHLSAWISLAMLHAEDNDIMATNEAIQNFLDMNTQYVDIVSTHKALNAERIRLAAESEDNFAKHRDLVECLMSMARLVPAGEIDADIQIALGLLFINSEEYDKAHDCFQAALSVHPGDHLYNYVGKMLDKAGRTAEALEYYRQSIQLNPAYDNPARLRTVKLYFQHQMYEDATKPLLETLMVIGSSSNANSFEKLLASGLWNILKINCMMLKRPDLVFLCNRMDLHDFDGFLGYSL